MGETAIEALRKAVTTCDDAEVRRREEKLLEPLLRKLYIELRVFKDDTSYIYSVAFGPDGKRALSGSFDKTVRLWDLATGKVVRRFEGHTLSILSVAFSPDGKPTGRDRVRSACCWPETRLLIDVTPR
jgi:WD40 repeat protein